MVAVSLLLSFEQAPFHHIHRSDLHHEHARGFAHFHWHAGQSNGQAIHDPDSDAQMLDWLASDGTSPIKHTLSLPEAVVSPAIVVVAERVITRETHNHDPPPVPQLFLRGPPA